MDVEMPIMNGLDATKQIMATHPIPVIMLSSLTKEGADATMEALDNGAIDFIPKPSQLLKVNTAEVRDDLLAKIRTASKVKLNKTVPIARRARQTPTRRPVQPRVSTGRTSFKKIVAIGTSTGGPKALQSVIPLISESINAPIVVVQHMPPGFTKSLADRLDTLSEVSVKEAEHGDVLEAGKVYIAPGDHHLLVRKQAGKFVVELSKGDLVSGHRPSVDAMMDSIYQLGINNVIGVIMTGMGADGAKGLEKLKERRAHIIAQDEESCVVFGMPKATIKLGVVDEVVSLSKISDCIEKAMEV